MQVITDEKMKGRVCMIKSKLATKIMLGLLLATPWTVNYAFAAEGILYDGETQVNENTVVNITNPADRLFAIRAQAYLNESAFDVKLNGETINVSMIADEDSGKTGTYFNGIEAGTFTNGNTKYDGPNLYLGDENTKDIIIRTNVSGKENGTIGLWSYNQYVGVKYQTNDGPQINVNGDNLTISVYAEDSSSYGICAQNSSTQTTGTPATININTDNTVITASSGLEGAGSGIVAMSEGVVNINSNLVVKADNAIVARGGAEVNINKDGTKTTQLNGDINFNYNGPTSGTKVDADVTVNLTGADSYWNGNSTVTWDYEANTKPNDDMLKVKDFKLTVADGAQWNPNKIDRTDDTYEYEGKEYVTGGAYLALNNLTLNDGIISLEKMGDQALIVENVTGNGGIVNVASSDNKLEFKSNAIEALTVAATESYAEELVQNDMAESLQSLADQVADTSAGVDSSKSAATDVYLSATSVTGITTAELDENGKVILDTVNERVNTSNNAISNMASIAYMAWRAENNDMNKRLGELRDSKGEHGIWARMVRGESEYESIKNQYNTYQLGYDEKLSTNPNWTVGAALSYTEGESGFNGGSGENKHTGFAVYGSYLNDDGSFIDLIAKYARLDHEFDVLGGAGSGDYETNGYSVSAEYGKRFKQSNGMWIEPQVELTYGKIGSANYKTSEGVSVRQDGMDSLVGRVGFALGKDFEQGNAYVRASYLYDFEGETDVSFTKGNVTRGFEQDLGGGWFEVGIGTNINLSDATHLYFDVEKTYGGDVATPWQWSAGVRYSF